MNIALIMVIAYLVITTIISLFFARRNKNSKEYFAASRSLGTALIVTMLFSEIVAGSGTIGNAADAFSGGVSSVWANWGMALGCFIFVPLVGKFYRSMAVHKDVVSIPQAYYYRFDKRVRIVMVVIMVVVYVILYSTQATAAASIIAPMLGVDKALVTWIVTALFILVTITGGMGGIAWMNAIHALVMYVGMFIVCFKALSTVGGMEALTATLDSSYFSLAQPNLATTLASALGTALSFLAAANITTCTFGAKNLHSAQRGVFIGGIIVIPFALAPALIGMCAKVLMPGIAANSALYGMANHLGVGFAGLVSMAIIAAIWSTAPTLLLIVCTTITRDIFKSYLRPEASDREQIRFSRILAVVIGIVGTLVGMNAASILGQMLGAFQIRSVAGIVLMVAIFWPRVSSSAAFWSMLAGGIVAAVWQFGGKPFGLSPLWPAALVCLTILIPMTLLSKEKVAPGYRLYQEAVDDMRRQESEAELAKETG